MASGLGPIKFLEAQMDAIIERGHLPLATITKLRSKPQPPTTRLAVEPWSPFQACNVVTVLFDLWEQISRDEESSRFATLADLTHYSFDRTYHVPHIANARLAQFAAAVDQAREFPTSWQVSSRLNIYLRLLNERNMQCFSAITSFLDKIALQHAGGVDALLQLILKNTSRVYIPVFGGIVVCRSSVDGGHEPTHVKTKAVSSGFDALLDHPESMLYVHALTALLAELELDQFEEAPQHTVQSSDGSRSPTCGGVSGEDLFSSKAHTPARRPSSRGTNNPYSKLFSRILEVRPKAAGGSLVDLDLFLSCICDCFHLGRTSDNTPTPVMTSTRRGDYSPAQSKYSLQLRQGLMKIMSHEHRVLVPARSILLQDDDNGFTEKEADQHAGTRCKSNGPCVDAGRGLEPRAVIAPSDLILAKKARFPSPENRLLLQNVVPKSSENTDTRAIIRNVEDTTHQRHQLSSQQSLPQKIQAPLLEFGCAMGLLHNAAGEDISFEEMRLITSLIKCERLVTVGFQLPTGRRITLRCSAVETVLDARRRLLSLVKGSLADVNLVSCDNLLLPDTALISREAAHNNSTFWVLPASLICRLQWKQRARRKDIIPLTFPQRSPSSYGHPTMTRSSTLRRKTEAVILGNLDVGFAKRHPVLPDSTIRESR